MAEAGSPVRIGVDLGGTKISALALGRDDNVLTHHRIATPAADYQATIRAVAKLVHTIKNELAITDATVGIGIPGAPAPGSHPGAGLIRNANSTCLNGKPLQADLETALGQSVRLANDADCFAISEASDGAAKGAATVWGLILGTGCGSGIVINGDVLTGPMAIAGEWGHNPLPHLTPDEAAANVICWCGRKNCIEAWVSGPALTRDHGQRAGVALPASEICRLAEAGDHVARTTLEQHANRLARAMATIINVLDPEVIVIGGGLGNMSHLYTAIPREIRPYIFSDHIHIDLRRPHWGDDSGVRGAARLWNEDH